MIEVKRVAEEWEIWDEKEEAASARNSWRGCPHKKSGIMQLI